MNSGIYRLIFASGRFYIGKSTDIPIRWRQHYDKLRNGTGSARLQQEFNRYHDYNQEVLLECHPDHIDIMETYYINYYDKKMMLNSTFPIPLSRGEYEPILANIGTLKFSTSNHISVLAEQTKTIQQLQEELIKERKKPAIIIKEYGNSTAYIQELQTEIDKLETENEQLLSRLEVVNNPAKTTNWFTRIIG